MKKPHIAVFHTWPDIKNAEFENTIRIVDAANNIGVDVSVIDNNGYIVSSTNALYTKRSPRIDRRDCEFAISLHFESPKTIDIYTYAALWNPLPFYFSWGYADTVDRLISHDDVLSCDADQADAHAINLLHSIGRLPPLPLPRFHHTLTKNVLEANIGPTSRCFYVGINWEKVNNTRGRHHELLNELDQLELVDIYGPELFQGVKPWEGYRCYRGSIPFDGKSTVKRISEAGICLAFSSAAHQNTGVMSNRLFEGLAAGAYIIANRHPFVEKFFKDTVAQIDDDVEGEQVAAQVIKEVRWVQQNPLEAAEKARRAQAIFLEKFTLEDEIARLVQGHAERRQAMADREPRASISVIVTFTSTSLSRLDEIISSLAAQTLPVLEIFVVADSRWLSFHRHAVDEIVGKCNMKVSFVEGEFFNFEPTSNSFAGRKNAVGRAVFRALNEVNGDFFLLTNQHEILFSDHLAQLATKLSARPDSYAAASGIVLEDALPNGRLSRRICFLSPPTLDGYLYGNNDRFYGQHLYRTTLRDRMNEYVFDLLDGQEHNYCNVIAFDAGQICNSFSATVVHSSAYEDQSMSPMIAIESQHQFVRDSVRNSSSRLGFLRANSFPSIVFAPPGGTAVGWLPPRRPAEIGALAQVGRTYAVCKGGDGARFAGMGFSYPEGDGIWIDGNIGILEFSVPAQPLGADDEPTLSVSLELLGRSAEKSSQDVFVFVNGTYVRHLSVESTYREWHAIEYKISKLSLGKDIKLRLVAADADPVKDETGAVLDPRRLALNVSAMKIDMGATIDTGAARIGEPA